MHEADDFKLKQQYVWLTAGTYDTSNHHIDELWVRKTLTNGPVCLFCVRR